ncbi:hypothetical protein Tco_1266306 [Tanacetum coccineum]
MALPDKTDDQILAIANDVGSTLHLPNEESVMGYLKFSAKGIKREVFGMPIPNDLITDDIRGEQYYNAYLEKVAKHQRYLAGEEVCDPDSPTPKLDKATKHKATKKSKPSAPKVAPVTKPNSRQCLPSLHTTKSARCQASGKETKLLIDEFADEGVPENEPRLDDEDAETSAGLLLSVKRRPGWTKPRVNMDEGQLDQNPGDLQQQSQPPSSHVVHAGPNLKHVDLKASDTSIQPNPEQMNEEFTTTAYLNVQENLKLPTEGEAPLPTLTATTTTTTTTLPLPPQPQQGSLDLILTLRIGELDQHMADLVQANLALEERMDKHGSRLYKLENLDIPHQVSKAVDEIVMDAVDWAIQAPLKDRFRDLPEAEA